MRRGCGRLLSNAEGWLKDSKPTFVRRELLGMKRLPAQEMLRPIMPQASVITLQ